MSAELSLQEIKKEWHGTLKTYVVGFTAAVLLTLLSFSLVVFKVLSGNSLIFALVCLALIQAAVQLYFFLHVGQEDKPRWETLIFYFMVVILLIVALGSLWIMYDLNNRTMLNMTKEMTHD